MPDVIELAHFSDNHLGYEAYRARNAGGENQRAADFARAFVNSCKDIIAADPPLVINTGDIADRPHIPIRFMVLIQHWFEKLSGIRPDGTRRQVVVVAGNHELPRQRREACFLDLFRGMPGVHVVTQGYKTVALDGTGSSEGCDTVLHDVVIHALPHDALKEVDFDVVTPEVGKVNILASHGVAGGSELYVRSLGREFAIPTDVLVRDWAYGALGHWHKQGPINLVSATGLSKKKAKEQAGRVAAEVEASGGEGLAPDEEAEGGTIWYAGSTENSGFGDLRDNGTKRGWLQVALEPGCSPRVRRRNLPIRAMFRLPHVDATGMDPDAITEALKANLTATDITGAVVGQVVNGVSREVWSMVDVTSVRKAASHALHYDPDPKYTTSERSKEAATSGLGDVAAVLDERAKALLTTDQVKPALDLATRLLEVALDAQMSAATKDSSQAHDASSEDPMPEKSTTDQTPEESK